MAEDSSAPSITIWLGMDTNPDDPRTLEAINRFFANEYLEQVHKTIPGLVNGQCYELLAADRHRGFGAKFLAVFALSDHDMAQLRQLTPLLRSLVAAAWQDRVTASWSLTYRFLAETGPCVTAPYAIYLAGVNPPSSMDDESRRTFIDFYTSVHIPEVVARKHCSRATAYELDHDLLHPDEGSPSFLGVYEAEDEFSVITQHVGFGYSRGPTVWQKHRTPWRLWYRRLVAARIGK